MLNLTPNKFHIAITGEISFAKRADIKRLLAEHNIGLASTVSCDVRYLIVGSTFRGKATGLNGSQKEMDARRFNIPIKGEACLLDILNMIVVNGKLASRAS